MEKSSFGTFGSPGIDDMQNAGARATHYCETADRGILTVPQPAEPGARAGWRVEEVWHFNAEAT